MMSLFDARGKSQGRQVGRGRKTKDRMRSGGKAVGLSALKVAWRSDKTMV